ncbi:SusC/RagA family TonB-linked outer membrane protein [Labilibaculum manganireducens]|uniref:SusC/RagA family TonB-linked outer membrane protein n=1 Tax=Labilibaculum manganireducens TaxID=1940525 RepID=A0A2N3IDW6_9BACT|nr:TonB-dependent receptor [Labilibaculum manganireducens]PKQ68475.1 SusC/RagA family TonB-linked outer membrane protein [Labilibaculum manganireducens]
MNENLKFNPILRKIIFYTIVCLLLISFFPANAAITKGDIAILQGEVIVKGTVKDINGEQLIGVNVIEKGTTNGTISNLNGDFSITVSSENATLVFSYIGFNQQEFAIGNKREFNVVMKENMTGLDEVVIVGYGSQKKATLTGSISQVSGDDLKKVSAANLTNTLAGKTAGVIANVRSGEPGEDNATIFIRGKGTTGNNSPLIIVDGIAGRGFSRLNPEDIESISVLKDASAAIYGARAANGVILVTTKRGKKGGITVKYNGDYSISQPTRIPDMLNSLQYATYVNEYDRGHGLSETYSEDALQKLQDGSDPINYANTDWWNSAAKKWAPKTQHNISVSGGNEKVQFYTSAQYMWQDVIYKNSPQDYSQYQFTANLDAELSKRIRFGLDVNGRQESRKRGVYATDYLFGYFLTTNPMAAPYYENGLPRVGFDGVTNNAAVMVTDQPGTSEKKNNIINLKPFLHIDLDFITKGLYTEGYAALDYSFQNGKDINHPYDLYQYDSATDKYNSKRSATGAISLNSWADNSDAITINARLGYQNSFGNHKIDAFAAYEQYKYNYNNVSAYRTNYLSTSIMQIFAGSSNPEDQGTGGYAGVSARQNYFGRINYNFNDKYLAEISLRYDGSMNFPANKRWGLFPAISLGWIMSEESFFSPLKSVVNFFKLKGSWGMMGNDNINPFQFLSSYGFISTEDHSSDGVLFGDAVQKGLFEKVTANPYITWETAKTTNLGTSAQFLDGKFNLDFDYFVSKRTDILRTRNASIPDYAGLALPAENIGKVKNSGIEIVAGYNGSHGDFKWNVSGNFTFAENKMEYIDEAVSTPAWQRATGHPIDAMVLYDALGIYQTQEEVDNSVHIDGAKPGDLIYRDTNDDGNITYDDAIRVNESATPKIVYGLTLNGSWKGLDFNAFFQGQAKAKMMVQPTMNMMTDFYEGRWSDANSAEKNAKARWPRAFIKQTYGDDFNGRASTWWLRDARFLRLKSVELGYSLPKSISHKMGITNLRFYVNGSNLFTIDKIKDFDPEISINADNYQANGLTAYPLQRTITTGVNLSF